MAKNHWIVTKDYTEDICRSVAITSLGFPFDLQRDEDWYCAMPVRFRMYDDDGNLYYSGRMMEPDFEPLDDFGMPNAGCTYIKYALGKEKFQVL